MARYRGAFIPSGFLRATIVAIARLVKSNTLYSDWTVLGARNKSNNPRNHFPPPSSQRERVIKRDGVRLPPFSLFYQCPYRF